MEAVTFQPLPLIKNVKQTVDNFYKLLCVCSLPSTTHHHFEKKNLHLLLLLYLLRLNLLFRTTLCFFYFDIITRVECATVLLNLFVIADPLMYFLPLSSRNPANKNLEITNCLQENQIFR